MSLASQKLMDALKAIGLNLYERSIWIALLSKGSATVGELAEMANIPRNRAYDVLESLANKGFVVLQPSRPLKAIALPPEEALERAKKKIEEEFRMTTQRIDDLKNSAIMKELKEIYQKGFKTLSPEEITGALKGSSVFQQLDSMFKAATKNISIVTTPEGLKELLQYHFETLRKAKEKGVDIKIVSPINDEVKEEVKVLSNIAQIRSINEKEIQLYGKFAIIDDKEIVMSLVNPKEERKEEIAIWTKSEHAASNILSPLFKIVWEKSKAI
ncbi:MAG: TrmB family transcriptional regulator [Candidatus Aenigmatarchaeota archaeon]